MAVGTGRESFFGFKAESAWGTPVTPDEFLPLVSESMSRTDSKIESDAHMAGQRTIRSAQRKSGAIAVTGDVGLELYSTDIRTLLTHMFGDESGSGPYTYTPGSLTGLGLTVQLGLTSGFAKEYTGCKVSSWEIACSEGQNATLGLSLIGRTETQETSTGVATPSYTEGLCAFRYIDATVSVAASSVNVTQLTLSGDNMLEPRRFLGSALTAEPLESGAVNRTYEGSLQAEFVDFTQYARFTANTEAALVITFNDGASNTLVITTNVQFDGETPQGGGSNVIAQPIPFKCVAPDDGDDSDAITAVLTLAS